MVKWWNGRWVVLFVVKDVLRENIGNLCKGRLLAGEPLLSTRLVSNAVSLLSTWNFPFSTFHFPFPLQFCKGRSMCMSKRFVV